MGGASTNVTVFRRNLRRPKVLRRFAAEPIMSECGAVELRRRPGGGGSSNLLPPTDLRHRRHAADRRRLQLSPPKLMWHVALINPGLTGGLSS